MERSHVDLLVLDLMLPGEDVSPCVAAAQPLQVPIIMLTARGEDVDRIVGLELGADDYHGEAVQPARAPRPHQGDPAPCGACPRDPSPRAYPFFLRWLAVDTITRTLTMLPARPCPERRGIPAAAVLLGSGTACSAARS